MTKKYISEVVFIEKAVDGLLKDLADRPGFRAVWDGLHPYSRREIRIAWRNNLERLFSKYGIHGNWR